MIGAVFKRCVFLESEKKRGFFISDQVCFVSRVYMLVYLSDMQYIVAVSSVPTLQFSLVFSLFSRRTQLVRRELARS